MAPTASQQDTRKIRISHYVACIADGSDVSSVEAAAQPGNYDVGLARELERVGTAGGMIELTREGLLDLAEWTDALSLSESQGGNPSGARALENLGRKCYELAAAMTTHYRLDELEGEDLGGGWTRKRVTLKAGDTASNPLSSKGPLRGPMHVVYDCARSGITVHLFGTEAEADAELAKWAADYEQRQAERAAVAS